MSSYVTSVVLGNDLVCRLSYSSLHKLRNDVLNAISRAKVNKMVVIKAVFDDVDVEELMHPVNEEPDSEFKQHLLKYKVGRILLPLFTCTPIPL